MPRYKLAQLGRRLTVLVGQGIDGCGHTCDIQPLIDQRLEGLVVELDPAID